LLDADGRAEGFGAIYHRIEELKLGAGFGIGVRRADGPLAVTRLPVSFRRDALLVS
jgi:hypothetical protein